MIPFNKPHLTGKEAHYLYQAVNSGKISGNGQFTQKCHDFFQKNLGFNKVLLTTSCTDALEMSAILADIQPGDEVIVPSYTFVSTPNAFVLRGAKIIFADSGPENPNIDVSKIEQHITKKTKAIIPVHYAGIACDMDPILELAKEYDLLVVEDAAQAIDSFYKGRQLGTMGDLSAFSFHETKNIISGEGGLLAINDSKFSRRADIIWEKGTNRAEFYRGEINKYEWVDIGSSFLPSEIISAFLFAQLENLNEIQSKRKLIWQKYHENFKDLEQLNGIKTPKIPDFATNNAHMYYLECCDIDQRDRLIKYLKDAGILAVFHYISLHRSKFYLSQNEIVNLPNCERYSDCIVRLPLFYELEENEIYYIIEKLRKFV